MRDRNEPTTQENRSNIQCIEVLISKNFIGDSSHKVLWTLSMYSLQNQPVQKNRALNNAEVFHFMLYDWNRTIQQLLDNLQVPYSIIQYFDSKDIHSTSTETVSTAGEEEKRLLAAVNDLADHPYVGFSKAPLEFSKRDVDLVID